MRELITGASGFAGGWLARACAQTGDEVLGAADSGTIPRGCGRGVAIDLSRGAALVRLRDSEPEVIHHLAALSHVGRSWEDPEATMPTNATGRRLRRESAKPRDWRSAPAGPRHDVS